MSCLLILADKLDMTKDRLKPRYKEFDFLWFMESVENVDVELENNILKIIIMTNEELAFNDLNKYGGLDKTLKILDSLDKRFNLSHEIIVRSIKE